MIVDADRPTAVIVFGDDGRVEHVVIDATRAALEALVGDGMQLRETTAMLLLVDAPSGRRNRLAEAVQGIYGFTGQVRGPMVIVGFDGSELRDAPGAARLAVLGG